MKFSVTTTGIKELKRAVNKKKNVDKAVKSILVEYTGQFKDEVTKNAMPGGKPKRPNLIKNRPGKIFVKGYSNADIKDSLVDFVDEPVNGVWRGTVGTPEHYAEYVEYGTRRMQAEPFMKPAYDEFEPKLEKAFEKIMK